MNNVVTYSSYKIVQLEARIAFLEDIIENKLGIKLDKVINETGPI